MTSIEIKDLSPDVDQRAFKTGLIEGVIASRRVGQLYLGGDPPLNGAISGTNNADRFRLFFWPSPASTMLVFSFASVCGDKEILSILIAVTPLRDAL